MLLQSVLDPDVRKGPGSPAVGLHPQALGEPPLCLVCFWTFHLAHRLRLLCVHQTHTVCITTFQCVLVPWRLSPLLFFIFG